MATSTYDAIVIGAGHNGLCLAAYLQRAGLSTAIIERRHEEGGGVNTEEPVKAGFRHNMHAQFMEFFDIMPMIQDFGLHDLGLRTVTPDVQAGIAFADGRPPIVLHQPELLDRTHASIARYSRADADLFVEVKQRAAKLEELLAIGLYNPPAAGQAMGGDALKATMLEATFGDIGIDSHYMFKSPKMVIDELFETPELRALMYRVTVEFGLPLDTNGTGTDFLTFLMWTTANWKLVRGGTHSLAKAMTQACYREGVDLIENSLVERIIVEDGRAVGVTARGTDYRATKLVASNADVRQTLLGLVGVEHLSPVWAKRAADFRYGPSHVLATPMFCLYEAPEYKSARWEPDIDRCFYTVVGNDGPEDMARYIRDAYSGRLPKPAAGTWVNSLWDRSQAPEGRHSATGWYFFPCASELSTAEWTEVREHYNEQFLDTWAEFAPNMTRDNVIAHKLYTPDQMERKVMMREGDFSHGEFVPDQQGVNRPFPEASNYLTEIDGLYLCGPSAYPGGGVHSACGYNAYKKIAGDLDLRSSIGSGRSY